MKSSEQIAKLAPALVAAAGELKNPVADGEARVQPKGGGAAFSYRYPRLEVIVADVREVLARHGVAAVQEAVTDQNGHVGITTRLQHESGEWLELGPLFLPSGVSAQDAGGAITYARRYALTAALLLAADEDQDAANVGKARSRQKREPDPDRVAESQARKAEADAKQPPDEIERKRLLTEAVEVFGSQRAVVDAYREEYKPTGSVAVKDITAEQLTSLIATMRALQESAS